MRDFKKFEVWQLSHQLTLKIYTATKSFPKEEIFGLTSQIRKSFASIGYNISEGSGRNSDKEFANFINIALGSSMLLNLKSSSRKTKQLREAPHRVR